MSAIVVEDYYKRKAKDLTNLLFDKRFLADDLAREPLAALEDYIAFEFQCVANSARECERLVAQFRDVAKCQKN